MARPLPRPHDGDDDGLPPATLYETAVEEYRFQARFNWSRTQYLLAFNAAILAAGSAVAARPGRAAALVFLLGAVAALLSLFATRQSHDYYRAARDRMKRVEDLLDVPTAARVDTTSTLGGRRRRASVNQVVNLLFVALVVAHAVGVVIVLVGSRGAG